MLDAVVDGRLRADWVIGRGGSLEVDDVDQRERMTVWPLEEMGSLQRSSEQGGVISSKERGMPG
jgi:hypothetical protein